MRTIFLRCKNMISAATSAAIISVVTSCLLEKSVKNASDTGNAAAPITEPSETYFEIATKIKNAAKTAIPQRQSTMIDMIPPTATPFPPLNLKNTGKQCPRQQQNPVSATAGCTHCGQLSVKIAHAPTVATKVFEKSVISVMTPARPAVAAHHVGAARIAAAA